MGLSAAVEKVLAADVIACADGGGINKVHACREDQQVIDKSQSHLKIKGQFTIIP
ncbi:MAG: hypothetical protein ACI9J2_002879 [Saprospiraceae bacterium]|jgi:hypothetical protein